MDIEKIRKDRKITQVELARRVGVSVNTIQAWERRVSTPTADNYKRLAEALNDLPILGEPKGE